MMGKISAWAALAMAVMFAVNAYFQFATGVSGGLYVGVAVILASGGFRTLGKMSGGLRLLAGAWGVVVGLLSAPLPAAISARAAGSSPLEFGLVLIALLGLVLTVMHKETK